MSKNEITNPDTTTTEPIEVPVVDTSVDSVVETEEKNISDKQKKSKKKTIIIIAIITLVVATIAIVIFAIVSKKTSLANEPSPIPKESVEDKETSDLSTPYSNGVDGEVVNPTDSVNTKDNLATVEPTPIVDNASEDGTASTNANSSIGATTGANANTPSVGGSTGANANSPSTDRTTGANATAPSMETPSSTITPAILDAYKKKDKTSCQALVSCVNAALANEQVYNEVCLLAKNGYYIFEIRPSGVILSKGKQLNADLKASTGGLTAPIEPGKNTYYALIEATYKNQLITLGACYVITGTIGNIPAPEAFLTE